MRRGRGAQDRRKRPLTHLHRDCNYHRTTNKTKTHTHSPRAHSLIAHTGVRPIQQPALACRGGRLPPWQTSPDKDAVAPFPTERTWCEPTPRQNLGEENAFGHDSGCVPGFSQDPRLVEAAAVLGNLVRLLLGHGKSLIDGVKYAMRWRGIPSRGVVKYYSSLPVMSSRFYVPRAW